ncbi:Na+/H+ antiporter NhaC family protein [Brevibacterium litoralis]|uniref:Na+/H+ antiporter NhaC family protein n=1 Tax=Brevibacterium litoralis TaxID=3138935 RepID=UPI0032EB9D0A
MIEAYPVLTLAPAVVAILLVVLTRKVLLSLGSGILLAGLLIHGFHPVDAIVEIWGSFAAVFWDTGTVNTWYVYILAFVALLGVIAAFIMMSGGTRAFADWAVTRIRGRRGAQMLAGVLGIVIFIDDYFNALAVGQVSRPVTDRHRVSRAKLAYLIDSTSAPVAVLAPFSSWGAYVMGLLVPIVAASALTMSSVEAFLGAALSNYYAIAAVLLVWLTMVLRLDLGPMRKEERRALEEGRTFDPDAEIPGEIADDLPVNRPGAMRALIVPFLLLVAGVFAGILWSGWSAVRAANAEDPTAYPTWGLIDVLAETDASKALMVGGVLGLAATLYYYLRYTTRNPRFSLATFGRGWYEGVKSMMPALCILVLAWMLGGLIETLGTGEYLGQVVESTAVGPAWLVPLVFLIAAAMAFATGTSWGSFGLLLPLVGGIMNAVGEPDLLLPALGAVLAGAVAGDHASPISDTTILSSTGAGSSVIGHVLTQLPYAGLAGGSALVGYLVAALLGSAVLGLLATVVVLIGAALLLRAVLPPLVAPATEPEQSAA